MNGPQDLGGAMGFGPVSPEPDEPVFHADWERRALALTVAAGALGAWTLDESRHARESLHPAEYYRASYYEIWIAGLERLLARHRLVTDAAGAVDDAIATGTAAPRVLRGDEVVAALGRGAPVARDPAGRTARFRADDAVRTRVMHPAHHTRLPRYARGKRGRIDAVRGFHVFPDSNAHGGGEAPQWLYTVAFDGRELWGADADPRSVVSIDAWESYLEPV